MRMTTRLRAPTPWADTVIYECHVKGMTMRHPRVPARLRGTYAGLAHDAVLDHLTSLGVTAVELMPIARAEDEPHLGRLGLTNYWGYNPADWFAPDPRFAADPDDPADELRRTVHELHDADLEVYLDVVFNHTSRGALPDRFYLRDERGRLVDWTGCGNTVDFGREEARELVTQCLIHWVEEFGVDGFRFDLATTMGRGGDLLERLTREPLLDGVKLIAEPWDLGPDGYRLGRFPAGWRQWNDKFRIAARSFWRGDAGTAPELATRLGGSTDVLRSPTSSINYVACHDGFTLHDLVRYDRKHNEANGEGGRDGSDHNHSRDFGVAARVAARSLLGTLLVARGVPMLGHGDELGRTQRGNNNAYCHDSDLTWVDWRDADGELTAWVRQAVALRKRCAALRTDAPYAEHEARWFDAAGEELRGDGWRGRPLRSFALRVGDELAVLMNADDAHAEFALPQPESWTVALDAAGHTQPGNLAAHGLQVVVRGSLG